MLPNGKLLIAGGNSGISSAELYDPTTGQCVATGAMSTNRTQHTATLLPNGKVLVAGGWNGSVSLSSTELYDPGTGSWDTPSKLHFVPINLWDGQLSLTRFTLCQENGFEF
jgi:hypothetical protein